MFAKTTPKCRPRSRRLLGCTSGALRTARGRSKRMTKNSLDITGNDLNRKIELILFLNLACRPEQDPDNLPVRALELEPTQQLTEGPSPDQAADHLAQDSHHQPGPGHHQENRQLARA